MRFPIGRRFAVSSAADWVRLAPVVAWLLGPAAWRLVRVGKRGDRRRLHDLERRWARQVRRALAVDLHLIGLDRAVGPSVVLPLHEGFFDAVALLHLPLDLTFLAREELFEWPVLGTYLQATEQVIVPTRGDRSSARRVLAEAARVIEAGESLVVFPQGSILGVEVAFDPGAFRLARHLDVPVVPVVISGSHRVWEHPYAPTLRRRVRVDLEVMAPLPPGVALTEARRIEREMKRRALANRAAPVRRFDPDRDGFWDGYRYEIDPDFAELAARVAEHRAGAGDSQIPAR